MKNIIYSSQYQNLHMDRANPEAMKTVNITIATSLGKSSTPRLLYRYKHGYDYKPQFWGLWDINFFPNSSANTRVKRGYGLIPHNTGIGLTVNFYYIVDDEYVNLYLLYNTIQTPPNIAGTTAKFTGYLFANGVDSQDYSK